MTQKSLSDIEKEVLRFWEEKRIFQKSLSQNKGKKVFSFYDGPPFATGQPHYGHILATTIKDAVLRYWTMRGYYVPRRVGWDCHGLPVENLIEKELGIKNKKEIEELGVGAFNDACRASVFRCVEDFQEVLRRAGRWADYKDSYATLDTGYIESVWWVLSQLHALGLVKRDYRVSPYCARCGTPLSNFEVNQGYQIKTDPSVVIKFQITNSKSQINSKFKITNPKTYLLAWTTTPWTLPGNVALAVHPDKEYIQVRQEKEIYILAKDRLEILEGPYAIQRSWKGKDLAGLRYHPLFDALERSKPENIENAFQVLEADFVSMEDGTGIVHTAVMYGEDDFQLGKKHKLPMHHTVDLNGVLKEETGELAGTRVKDAQQKVITLLKEKNLLYKAEEMEHSYPFCWRCDDPLIYYAMDSWYITVSSLRKQLVANNKKIQWVPSHVKEKRFGSWLKEARDWAFSRNRYWGAPLPIWKCEDCGEENVLSSVKDIISKKHTTNRYHMMRHGHSLRQIKNVVSSYPEKEPLPLTPKGVADVKKAAKNLAKKGVDIIYSSDLLRCKQTAELVAKATGARVVFDKRLREADGGVFNGRPVKEAIAFWEREGEAQKDDYARRFSVRPPKGESYLDIQKRLFDLMENLESNHKGKNILVISHELPLTLLKGLMNGTSREDIVRSREKKRIQPSEIKPFSYRSLPYDKEMNIDLHRPYIDRVMFACSSCEGLMKRTPEVFDCWFESGSMPYAQWHYPQERKKLVESTFPADFIAEGMDQTRGWFYTLHVLATALTLKNIGLGKNKPAFKNVIVNGLVLASDGKKLSKRLKNYPEVDLVFNKYGADALRYFLLSSTPIGEDYLLSEERVQETMRKVPMAFQNSASFFLLYKEKGFKENLTFRPKTALDKWIFSRLNRTIEEMTSRMDSFELTKGSRPALMFLEDLSNWYIRRSRPRLQRPTSPKEKEEASQTLHHALKTFSQLLSPFTPFITEHVFSQLRGGRDKESVHLMPWPKANKKLISKKLENDMEEVRSVVAQALAERGKAGVKVRQPLSSITLNEASLRGKKELLSLIQEEVNIKEVLFDVEQKEDVVLDITLTQELLEEGQVRELIRHIQDLRKEAGLVPTDKAVVWVEGGLVPLAEKYRADVSKSANLKEVRMGKPEKNILGERKIHVEGAETILSITRA
ncbi:MAG: class I tRNA ligase family protein [bacterium]|nr:class I tRNA ligase family protein [bacterium]